VTAQAKAVLASHSNAAQPRRGDDVPAKVRLHDTIKDLNRRLGAALSEAGRP
jgi:hypothetical protein